MSTVANAGEVNFLRAVQERIEIDVVRLVRAEEPDQCVLVPIGDGSTRRILACRRGTHETGKHHRDDAERREQPQYVAWPLQMSVLLPHSHTKNPSHLT